MSGHLAGISVTGGHRLQVHARLARLLLTRAELLHADSPQGLASYTSGLGASGALGTLLSWREFSLNMNLDFRSQQSRHRVA